MSKSATIIDRAYKLESLLRVLALATESEETSGKTFQQSGGGAILELAAEMAGEIVNSLEKAENASKG